MMSDTVEITYNDYDTLKEGGTVKLFRGARIKLTEKAVEKIKEEEEQ